MGVIVNPGHFLSGGPFPCTDVRWHRVGMDDSPLRCYLAAPYDDAPLVRDLHRRLSARGVRCTSAWAEQADGPERLDLMPLEELRARALANDVALAESDVVVVLPREGKGREMYGEARLAVAFGIPVIWVGPTRCLTSYRAGVECVDDVEAAVREIVARAAAWARRLRAVDAA